MLWHLPFIRMRSRKSGKRKIRFAILRKSAMSGASVVNVGSQGAPESEKSDLFDSLEKAIKLFDTGVVSDAEYQELKAKIISKDT